MSLAVALFRLPIQVHYFIWHYGLIFMVSLIIFVHGVSCCCSLVMVA